jgi:hypothetical protein
MQVSHFLTDNGACFVKGRLQLLLVSRVFLRFHLLLLDFCGLHEMSTSYTWYTFVSGYYQRVLRKRRGLEKMYKVHKMHTAAAFGLSRRVDLQFCHNESFCAAGVSNQIEAQMRAKDAAYVSTHQEAQPLLLCRIHVAFFWD